MKGTIALAGAPNCGKTTLFNFITGSRAATGNWAGVTVQKKSGTLKADPKMEIIDLPGAYSLSPYSLEESVTKNFLINGKPNAVICVIDGTNPEHGIYLCLELCSLGIPIVLAVNFADELRKSDGSVNLFMLKKSLGIPAFLVSAKSGEGINGLVSAAIKAAESAGTEPCVPLPERERHEVADKLASQCFTRKKNSAGLLEKVDVFLTESRFSVLVCIMLLLIMFVTAFGYPGTLLKNTVDVLFKKFSTAVLALLNMLKVKNWLCSLIIDGIIGGFGSVMSFLPQTGLMFLIISFLEDSGYMARAAFVSDHALRRFGLSGRSIIPLLMGFGCTVPAVLATKSNTSEKERLLTISILPFIQCSAKLPLYLFFAAELFPRHRSVAVAGVYTLGIVFAVFYCMLNGPKQNTSFVLEIPPCRIPSLQSIIKSTIYKCQGFVAKSGTIVVGANIAVWFFSYFSPDFSVAKSLDESLLGAIGQFISPVFLPIGLEWREIIPIFCGLAAKEAAFSALVLLSDGNIGNLFSQTQAISFLIFFILYSPCFAALAAIKQELGIKKAVWVFLFQTAIAYCSSFVFYQIITLVQNLSELI